MKSNQAIDLLHQSLSELAAARNRLDYSFQQVAGLPENLAGISESELVSVEAFTGRFARVVDLLVNKVLRCLDRVEMKPEGTLLDVVIRAGRRGFVDSTDLLREMKDIRNVIAHDYAGENLNGIFAFCREEKLTLDAICDRVAQYITSALPG